MNKLIFVAIAASLLAACGGGGGTITSPTGGLAPAAPAATSNPGSGFGNVPVAGDPRGTQTVTATASIDADKLPASLNRSKNQIAHRLSALRQTSALAVKSVLVNGTLYQGAASARTVTNTASFTPVNNTVNVSMSFSNVVPANNDWIVFNFYAVGYDGSQTYLGNLGTMINVTTTGATAASLDASSTRRLSAILTGLSYGSISSYDIENTPTLDADVGTAIAGFAPDPATGLYTGNTLLQIAAALQTKYGRTVTLTSSSSGPAIFSIAMDYTKTDENDLVANAYQSGGAAPVANTGTANGTSYPGTPYGTYGSYYGYQNTYVPQQTPSTGLTDAQAVTASAVLFASTTNTITLPVYGGNLIVGAHAVTGPSTTGAVGLPPQGVTTSLAGRAPGASSLTLTVASTTTTFTTQSVTSALYRSPPQPGSSAAALPTPTANPSASPYPATFYASPLVTNSNGAVSFRANCASSYAAGYGSCYAVANATSYTPSYPTPAPGTTNAPQTTLNVLTYAPPSRLPAQYTYNPATQAATYTVDTWNPFGLTASQLGACTNPPTGCVPLTSSSITYISSFYDPTYNLTYFNWAPTGGSGDATTSIAQTYSSFGYANQGYVVTYNGQVGTFGTTVGSAIYPQQTISVQSTAPIGTTWTVTVVGTDGSTYTGSAPAQLQCLNITNPCTYTGSTVGTNAYITLPTALTFVTTKSITFQYTLPAGAPTSGSFVVTYL